MSAQLDAATRQLDVSEAALLDSKRQVVALEAELAVMAKQYNDQLEQCDQVRSMLVCCDERHHVAITLFLSSPFFLDPSDSQRQHSVTATCARHRGHAVCEQGPHHHSTCPAAPLQNPHS